MADGFQGRVINWMMETFDMETCRNTAERNHRFLEESLELVQALGCTAAEAHMLVDYTFGRPTGEAQQEVGGVMVTLAALCAAADMSMMDSAETELKRCWLNIDRIRAKQKSKPSSGPLPGTEQPKNACGECGSNIGWGRKHYPNCSASDHRCGAEMNYKSAIDAFVASEEYETSSDPMTLKAPERMRQYIENRLHRAFAAGWNAAMEQKQCTPQP